MANNLSNNWAIGLPGNNGAMFANGQVNNTNWQVTSNPAGAVTIKNKDGENVLIFHNDGMIETKSGKINADEWIQIARIMKQFIMDIASDEETSKKFPYIKEMAHTWVMDELRK
jgi:hypothetical protein